MTERDVGQGRSLGRPIEMKNPDGIATRFHTGGERQSARRGHGRGRPAEAPAVGSEADAERYRGLFESSPISLWEEDFSELKLHIDGLRRAGVTDLRDFFRDNPDELQRCASMVVVVDVNEATLELLECDDKRRLLGRLPIIFRKASYEVFLEEIVALAEGRSIFERDIVNETFSGNRIYVRMRLALAPGHEDTWAQVFVSLTDITEWKQAQALTQLQRVAMESAADAIFITRRDGTIEWANRAFVRMSGYTLEEAIGRTASLLDSEPHDAAFSTEPWRTLLSGRPWRDRKVNRHRSGALYTVEQTITPIVDDAGEITHFVTVQQDISERLESEKRLVRMARSDFLTGLANRHTFNDRLEREADRAARRGHSVAVLLLDLDRFQDVNDLFGHPVGDALLVEVGERLKQGVRSLDTIARLGGDEFAVLQTDADHPEATAILAQRLLSILERPFQIEGFTIRASASLGIAIGRAGEIDPREMIRQADLALSRAKQEGRGTYRFHAGEMDREVQDRLILSRDLRRALDNGQLSLAFQPQVDLSSGQVAGVEALLRWTHPERGPVPPARFIPIAENDGFIVPLGEWVLHTACTAYRDFRRMVGEHLRLAVNVSAVQMRAPGFAGTVLRVLRQSGVPPTALELELTESILMHRTPRLERAMKELHRVGVRFSVDDFGTGFSSMVYLRQAWVDKLKIDRSFLEEVETSPSDAAIVSAVIALGNKLGIEVVAEGVERQSQVGFLRSNGCEAAQGYLFGHPAPLEATIRHLETGR